MQPVNPNTIFLTGLFRLVEGLAAGTIFPGMLLVQGSTGFTAHATAGGFSERLFAKEDALQGGTVLGFPSNYGLSGSTYTGYTTAGVGGQGPDPVQAIAMVPGGIVNALLQGGHNYPVGTQLISGGDGTLKPTTGSPTQILGVIPQGFAINLSASYTTNTLNPVRIQ